MLSLWYRSSYGFRSKCTCKDMDFGARVSKMLSRFRTEGLKYAYSIILIRCNALYVLLL